VEGKGGQNIGLTTLPPLFADFLEILGASTSWSPQALYRDSFTLIYIKLLCNGKRYKRDRIENVKTSRKLL
jgi:hypothetical protein